MRLLQASMRHHAQADPARSVTCVVLTVLSIHITRVYSLSYKIYARITTLEYAFYDAY